MIRTSNAYAFIDQRPPARAGPEAAWDGIDGRQQHCIARNRRLARLSAWIGAVVRGRMFLTRIVITDYSVSSYLP